jgi:hypothetical protein
MQRKTVEPGCPRLRSLFAKQTIARRNERKCALARTYGRGCIFPLIRVCFQSARCRVVGVCSVVGTCGPQASEPQRRQASYRRKPVSQRPMFRLCAVRKAACRQIRRRVNFRSFVRSYLVQGVSRICIPPAGLPQRRFSYTLAHKYWLTVL